MKGSADEHVRPFHLRPPLPPGFPTFATCGPLTDFDVTLHGNPRQAVLCKYNESTACRECPLAAEQGLARGHSPFYGPANPCSPASLVTDFLRLVHPINNETIQDGLE